MLEILRNSRIKIDSINRSSQHLIWTITTIYLLFVPHTSYCNMGLDVFLVSKERGEKSISINTLSRRFCNFLCGPEAYDNSEFEQVQNLLQLNLSLYRSYPINLEPDVHELEYKLLLAEENKDTEAVIRIQTKIKQVEKEWEESYNSINEGWIKVEELSTLTQAFISKLETYQNLHQSMTYNFDWNDYFENKIRDNHNETTYFHHTLIEDLLHLQKGLMQMKNKGIKYVAFQYG